ncbi:hypothetical protein ABIA32_001805 [Streptacidiphilus sp. MAP12-20]|uniref:hypothetical protein n=1 Tax=Streptacidiphilus sp. MAP12-20 TaxID=3156299 RepID=UPI00351195F1
MTMSGIRRLSIALGLGTAVALLASGCGTSNSGTTVVKSAPGTTTPAAPVRQMGKPCPVPGEWLGKPAPTSYNGTPANTPQGEELSQAIGAQSRVAAFADVYGTHITDFPAGRVALCVTDLAAGHRLAAAAKQADPKADLNRLDYYLCLYSQARLDRAAQLLVPHVAKGALGFPIDGFGPAQDASGVLVNTSAAGAKSAALKAELERLVGGIPVTLDASGPAVPA